MITDIQAETDAELIEKQDEEINRLTRELYLAKKMKCIVDPCQHRSPPAIGGNPLKVVDVCDCEEYYDYIDWEKKDNKE